MPTIAEQMCFDLSPSVPKRLHRTAVSRLLRAISLEAPSGIPFADEHGDRFRIMVAAGNQLRERAYALAHRVYSDIGYVTDEAEFRNCPFHAKPDTFTLLIANDEGRDVATASLVFDSIEDGLPCDEIYSAQLVAMRAGNRRLVEVTRLCIDDRVRSRGVLVRLFNFLFLQAVNLRDRSDCVIEVTPQHANYYQRLLSFEQLGPRKVCPRVGVEGVLLHLRREVYERELQRFRCADSVASDRTLYRHFLSLEREGVATDFLRQHQ